MSTHSPNDADPDALPPSTVLGDYVVDQAIGRGGFAITYRAHHARMTAQQVAIKEFFPDRLARRSHEGSVLRSKAEEFAAGCAEFLDEGQRLAMLAHPGVVRVINFFEGNGTAYLVMDYVAGQTLEARLAQGQRLEESRVRGLALKLLSALQAVHDGGLLHRDINPSNIMLRDDGEPVLIDFGAARSELAQRTRAVTSVVTDGYSPVEQYGTLANVQGPWTDLYALGATLYHLATGQRPLSAQSRQQAMFEGEPDPLPSATTLARNHHSAALLQWIDGLIQVQRNARPPTADQALRALQQIGRAATPELSGTRQVSEEQRFSEVSPRQWSPALSVECKAEPNTNDARGMGSQADLTARITASTQSNAPMHFRTESAAAQPDRKPVTTRSERSSGKWWKGAVVLAVLGASLWVLVASWSQSIENNPLAWQQANQEDSAAAYASYLKLWPEGSNASAAKQRQTERDEQLRLAGLSLAQREGERIKSIQRDLNVLGYRVGESGEADFRTTAAIKQFEQQQRLIVTGTPDAVLAQALQDEIARRDEAAWAATTRADTEPAYMEYQQKHPGGKYLWEVDIRIAEVSRKEVARPQEAARVAEERIKTKAREDEGVAWASATKDGT